MPYTGKMNWPIFRANGTITSWDMKASQRRIFLLKLKMKNMLVRAENIIIMIMYYVNFIIGGGSCFQLGGHHQQ